TLADVAGLRGGREGEETSQLFDALAANDGAAGVRLIGTLVDEGRDLRLFVRRAFDHMRALVLISSTGKAPELSSEGVAEKLDEQAPKFSLERLARIAKRLLETEQQLRTSEGTPLPLELAILDLVTTAAPAGATPPGGRATTTPPRVAAPPPSTARTATPAPPTVRTTNPAPAPARAAAPAPARQAPPTPMRTAPRSESS